MAHANSCYSSKPEEFTRQAVELFSSNGGPGLPANGRQHLPYFRTPAGWLAKYLDKFAAEESPFPHPERPLAMKNLKLIAFVQNDTTREILHAVQVDVP